MNSEVRISRSALVAVLEVAEIHSHPTAVCRIARYLAEQPASEVKVDGGYTGFGLLIGSIPQDVSAAMISLDGYRVIDFVYGDLSPLKKRKRLDITKPAIWQEKDQVNFPPCPEGRTKSVFFRWKQAIKGAIRDHS